jgi:hypothetical protein
MVLIFYDCWLAMNSVTLSHAAEWAGAWRLSPTPVRLKLLHACDQWHSSRVATPLTGWYCEFRPNTEGAAALAATLTLTLTLTRTLDSAQTLKAD